MKPAPIQIRKREEKTKKRNQTIIGLVIIFLMVTSVVGYAISNKATEKTETYNGYEFIKTENGWQTQININNNDIILQTYHLPQEVENITPATLGNPTLGDFQNKNLFIVAVSENERAAAYIFTPLSQFTTRTQIACSPEESNSTFCIDNNLPIKTCEDVNYNTAIIQIEELTNLNDTINTINFKNSCLTIKSNKNDIIKVAEKSLFIIFNIIE